MAYQVGSIFHLKVSNFAVTQSLYTMQAQGFGCLHYAMTQNVYFLVPSEGRHNDYFLMACVFLMQPLGMSTLCRDSDCLFYAGTWTVYFVQSPWVIKKTMCLLYDFTQTVYFLIASVYTMMACVFLMMSLWFVYLMTSSVYLVHGFLEKSLF